MRIRALPYICMMMHAYTNLAHTLSMISYSFAPLTLTCFRMSYDEHRQENIIHRATELNDVIHRADAE